MKLSNGDAPKHPPVDYTNEGIQDENRGKLNSPFAVAVFSGKEASFKEYQSFTLGDKNVFTLDGESKFLCTNIFLFVSHVAHYSALHQYPSNTT